MSRSASFAEQCSLVVPMKYPAGILGGGAPTQYPGAILEDSTIINCTEANKRVKDYIVTRLLKEEHGWAHAYEPPTSSSSCGAAHNWT